MLVRVPGPIEAVPLDGGAAVRVAELEGEDALRAERLPPVLRLP